MNTCPICGGEGYIYQKDEQGYEFVQVCKCTLAQRLNKRLANSGLINIQSHTMDQYKTDEAYQQRIKTVAEKYLQDQESPWFFIGGQVGCGKTHICTAICLELINNGLSVRYEIWSSIAARLKAMRNTEEFEMEMRRLQNVPTLYLDDFFRGWVSESDRSLAWELINGRYIQRRRTILSSERYLFEISDIDEAIGSRIQEMAGEYVCDVKREPQRNKRMEER